MKFLKYKFISILTIYSIILLFIITYSYAWFVQSLTIPTDVLGQTRSSYFGGGSGTITNPFLISNANHFYNLSYLQNMDYIKEGTYFEVTNDINFNDIDVLESHKTIKPIGTYTNQFKSTINGNGFSVISYTVDGSGLQDIGTFGYLGDGANIKNLILDSPIIKSNPVANQIVDTLHPHNSSNKNITTGYVAGHVSKNAKLEGVYVISPTISSTENSYANRSQFGLIGYSEDTEGYVGGIPENRQYSFSMDAVRANSQLLAAFEHYKSNYDIYNDDGSFSSLDKAISKDLYSNKVIIASNYSLSTLKVVPWDNHQATPIYFYDLIKGDYAIGTASSLYSRKNIDLVGSISFDTNGIFLGSPKNFKVPAISDFNPLAFGGGILLYVEARSGYLGDFTFTSATGVKLMFNSGWDTSGNYKKSIDNTRTVDITTKTTELQARNALTGVKQVDGVMKVNITNPDYYVFLITSNASANTQIKTIEFNYLPGNFAGTITEENLNKSKISGVDFIESKDDLISPYEYSYLNFGYELTGAQELSITTTKVNTVENEIKNAVYEISFEYSINDFSYFYIDIVNFKKKDIKIIYNDREIYKGTDQIIEIKVNAFDGNENNRFVVTSKNIDST